MVWSLGHSLTPPNAHVSHTRITTQGLKELDTPPPFGLAQPSGTRDCKTVPRHLSNGQSSSPCLPVRLKLMTYQLPTLTQLTIIKELTISECRCRPWKLSSKGLWLPCTSGTTRCIPHPRCWCSCMRFTDTRNVWIHSGSIWASTAQNSEGLQTDPKTCLQLPGQTHQGVGIFLSYICFTPCD